MYFMLDAYNTQVLLCDLSTIAYDYYAELESYEDMDYISTRIGMPGAFHSLTGMVPEVNVSDD